MIAAFIGVASSMPTSFLMLASAVAKDDSSGRATCEAMPARTSGDDRGRRVWVWAMDPVRKANVR